MRAKSPRARSEPVDLGRALIEAYLTSERINQVLIGQIDPGIWRRFPPSSPRRNIATTFAHVHNVRCMRLTMSAKDRKPPARLDRAAVTPAQAARALELSARAMVRLIEDSLASGGRVKDFRPDVVGLVAWAISHDAHHRGQICHWARELGAPLAPALQLELWEWGKRWKDVASDERRR